MDVRMLRCSAQPCWRGGRQGRSSRFYLHDAKLKVAPGCLWILFLVPFGLIASPDFYIFLI